MDSSVGGLRQNPLVRKLAIFADLGREELALLDELTRDVRSVRANGEIVSDGNRPEALHVIVEGWAACCKLLDDGKRQITAFLFPGDFCDVHSSVLKRLDNGVTALTTCKVAHVPSEGFHRAVADHSRLTQALWRGALHDEAIARAWIVNLGRRNAYARVAHLLCELHCRALALGLTADGRFDLPLTQQDIADATGLTAVHVNRTLQHLRSDGLIELSSRVLTMKDASALEQAAGFDSAYLQVAGRSITRGGMSALGRTRTLR